MKLQQYIKNNWIWMLLSLSALAGEIYLFGNYTDNAAFTALSLPLFSLIILFQYKFVEKVKESPVHGTGKIVLAYALSYLLQLSFLLGYQLESMGFTALGVKGKCLIIFFTALGAVSFLPVFYYIISKLETALSSKKEVNTVLTDKEKKHTFFISFVAIFAAWIPAFLAYFPAVMSYDFNVQSIQAVNGFQFFTTHHPLIHTLLIRLFLKFGQAIGSYSLGIAAFTLCQMLILSSIFAYACNMAGRIMGKKRYAYLTAAYFALLPFFPVLAIAITKDILFSAFFLLFILLQLEISFCTRKPYKALLYAASVPTGVLCMMFRNNALYAFIVYTLVYVILGGKKWYINLLISAAVITLSFTGLNTMEKQMNAIKGNKAEMFSVPIQQFARTGKYHDGYLLPEEYQIIDKYVHSYEWPNYNPPIADTVKGSVSHYFTVWEEDMSQTLKDWIFIGKRYPNDYIDAFLAMTEGYWFWDDVSHATVLGEGKTSGLGLIYTFNASKSSSFEGIENKELVPFVKDFYSSVLNGNGYMNIPILNILFKPAFYCWMTFWILCFAIYFRKKKAIVVSAWPLIYLLTLYLGPVVNFRYIFPFAVSVPILCLSLFIKEK